MTEQPHPLDSAPANVETDPPSAPRKAAPDQPLPKSTEELVAWQKAMLTQAVELLEDFRVEAKRDREERAAEKQSEVDREADYERQEYNGCLRLYSAEALMGLVEHELPPHQAADRAFEYAQAMYKKYMDLKRAKPSSE